MEEKKRVLKHSTASYVQAVLRNTVVNSLHKKAFKLKRKKNSLKLWYMGCRRIFLDYKWHMSLDQDVSRWKLTRSSDCGSGICMQA